MMRPARSRCARAAPGRPDYAFQVKGLCRQQRAALPKVLLLDPEILLMDEPTKGLDAEFKQGFAGILHVLLRRGVTVLMVSHDIEF